MFYPTVSFIYKIYTHMHKQQQCSRVAAAVVLTNSSGSAHQKQQRQRSAAAAAAALTTVTSSKQRLVAAAAALVSSSNAYQQQQQRLSVNILHILVSDSCVLCVYRYFGCFNLYICYYAHSATYLLIILAHATWRMPPGVCHLAYATHPSQHFRCPPASEIQLMFTLPIIIYAFCVEV